MPLCTRRQPLGIITAGHSSGQGRSVCGHGEGCGGQSRSRAAGDAALRERVLRYGLWHAVRQPWALVPALLGVRPDGVMTRLARPLLLAKRTYFRH
jgi:hypothetical protein